MKDLLGFIVKYSNLLVLLALEVVAFMLFVNGNDYPHSTMLSTANTLAAKQYEMESSVANYFSLRSRNNELSLENAILRMKVEELQALVNDSLANSANDYRDGNRYIPAMVIQSERRLSHNYLTINRGEKDGIRKGMGVRNNDGVVGIVCTVGEHYSVIIPIIHTASRISCTIAKNNYAGVVIWPGNSDHYALMEDVAIHVDVTEGDTVVSSGLTTAFPKGIPVGIVENCHINEGDSYYTIRLRLTTDFRSLDYVQVIDNRSENEIKQLLNGLD